jgi:hypothetical protein
MLQAARRRGGGVCWTAEEGEEKGEEEGEDASELHSVAIGGSAGGLVEASNFRSEAEAEGASVVKTQRDKFVEEKLNEIRMGDARYAKQAEANKKPEEPKSLEDALYDVPEFLKSDKEEIQDAGDRWLTGITEVLLPVSVKLGNIERTEAAKQVMLRKDAIKQAQKVGVGAPAGTGSLSSNYNKHSVEHGEKLKLKREQGQAQQDKKLISEGEIPKTRKAPDGKHNASDDVVMNRFVKRYKYKL